MSSKIFFSQLNAQLPTGLETSILPPQAQALSRKHRTHVLKGYLSMQGNLEYLLHGFEHTNRQTM